MMNLTRKGFIASLLGLFVAPFVKLKKEPNNRVYVKSGAYAINLVIKEADFLKTMQKSPDGYAYNCVIECEDAVDMNLINGWHANNCIWWSKKYDVAITGGNLGYCAMLPWRTSPFQSKDLLSQPGAFQGLKETVGYVKTA